MAVPGERILLVESDPDISDVIARQALQPLGYQVKVVGDANTAIKHAVKASPDMVITNLNLPGLSGKDLLVALNSQDIDIPIVILAEKGQEHDVIQAFRLGATDYLLWPAREAEVVSSVERALKQVRAARARQQLDRRLQEANQELQRKVSELTTMLGIGKAVVSITDQRVLFDKIVEGAVGVVRADMGWLLLRDENKKTFLLTAQRNLPDAWAKKMHQPLDDGISSLVALSGETLVIHGAPLRRFKISGLGKSAAVVPIKARQEVIGLLVVVRKAEKPFEQIAQTLLEAVGDYASISLVNAQLFRALKQTADAARAGEERQNATLRALREALQEEVKAASFSMDLLLHGKVGSLDAEQKQALQTAQAALQRLSLAAEQAISPITLSAKSE
ncbi:MAG: response regulator [Chloroflexi bacterium]|nr:response regulator [Chloroflexota bacterium]